jgi:hypothetical protein
MFRYRHRGPPALPPMRGSGACCIMSSVSRAISCRISWEIFLPSIIIMGEGIGLHGVYV